MCTKEFVIPPDMLCIIYCLILILSKCIRYKKTSVIWTHSPEERDLTIVVLFTTHELKTTLIKMLRAKRVHNCYDRSSTSFKLDIYLLTLCYYL